MFTNRDSCLLRTACGVLFFSTYILQHRGVNEKSIFNEHFENSKGFWEKIFFIICLQNLIDLFTNGGYNGIRASTFDSGPPKFTNCLQIKIDLFTISAIQKRRAFALLKSTPIPTDTLQELMLLRISKRPFFKPPKYCVTFRLHFAHYGQNF